jgi:hypothetical protein
MNENVKKMLDFAIDIMTDAMADEPNIEAAEKKLIISMSDSLRCGSGDKEAVEYMFQGSKRILKDLFKREEEMLANKN